MDNKDDAEIIADRNDPTTAVAVVSTILIAIIAHLIGAI